ncbi:MAG TPA: hypothetical protein VNT12_03100 [Rubrobacter sp.]|jgi:hypothetical protein|nr:hypothetical protein [Rubrobacter sp.]
MDDAKRGMDKRRLEAVTSFLDHRGIETGHLAARREVVCPAS